MFAQQNTFNALHDFTDAVTMASTLAVTGNTTMAGTLGVTGNTTVTGSVITSTGFSVGNTAVLGQEIDVSSGDFTLDVAGDIILDADGGDVKINDGGSARFHILTSATETQLFNQVQDADIVFKGDDGGSAITALTLDMSDAGSAYFNSNIYFAEYLTHAGDTDTYLQYTTNQIDLFAGNKRGITLTANEVIINQNGVDLDFNVETDNDTSTLFVQGSSDRVGIGTPSPDDRFHVKLSSGQRVARFESNDNTSAHIAFKAPNTSLMPTVGVKDEVLYFSTGDSYERARILGPSTSHSGFFKISDSGSYQGSTGAFHEIRSSSSNQSGVVIGASHASFSANVISIITQRANSSSFRYIQGLSSNTGDTDYSVRGDGEVFADGSFNSGGADYAEMFEWKDGNTSSEDRVGKTVVLDGNQIRLSTSDDAQATIIGVVSARPVVLGDAQSDKWKDKYETDSYGRYVFEEYTQTEWTIETDDGAKELKSYQTDMIPSDVTVPDDAIVTSKDQNGDNLKRRKLNSSFDASKTYIPREDRKEFSAIGLVGKLRVAVGQTIGDRWIKMREISDTVHEYLVR
jgi:cytoskeletal protein CcmA (bactofilin family)